MTRRFVTERLPSEEARFLPVDRNRDGEREWATLVAYADTPRVPRPLLDVLADVERMKQHGDENEQAVAHTFDAYYDWLLPWREAGRPRY